MDQGHAKIRFVVIIVILSLFACMMFDAPLTSGHDGRTPITVSRPLKDAEPYPGPHVKAVRCGDCGSTPREAVPLP